MDKDDAIAAKAKRLNEVLGSEARERARLKVEDLNSRGMLLSSITENHLIGICSAALSGFTKRLCEEYVNTVGARLNITDRAAEIQGHGRQFTSEFLAAHGRHLRELRNSFDSEMERILEGVPEELELAVFDRQNRPGFWARDWESIMAAAVTAIVVLLATSTFKTWVLPRVGMTP